MAEKLTKSKFTGVYQGESATKKHGGKPDVRYYYTIKLPNGKKSWVKVGWRSEGYSIQLAADERSKAVQAMRDGAYEESLGIQSITNKKQRSTAMTFDEAFKIFDEKHLQVNIKRPKDERQRYANYIKKYIGHRRLDAITILDIEAIRAEYAKYLAPASVLQILSDIRRVYRKLIELDIYTGRDPTLRLKMPKVDNARTRFLTQEEAATLMAELLPRSQKWYNIAMISLYSGMRLAEVLHLRYQDINMPGECVTIRDGKTGSRTIPMNKVVYTILESRLECIEHNPTALLFCKKDGALLAGSFAGKVFRNAVEKVGLNPEGTDSRNRVSFHTLRHTFCSWLAMQGIPLYTIGELVGHSTPAMTKRYSHLSPGLAKAATSILDSIDITLPAS